MNRIESFLKGHSTLKLIICIGATIVIITLLIFGGLNIGPIWAWFSNALSQVLRSLLPLLIGIILAYLLDPLITLICSKSKMSRPLAMVTVYFLMVLFLAGFCYGFLSVVLGYVPKGSISSMVDVAFQYLQSFKDTFNGALSNIPKFLDNSTFKLVKTMTQTILDLGIAIIISVYLQIDRELFLRWTRSLGHILLKQKHHGILSEFCFEAGQVFSTYIRGTLLDSIIVTVLSTLLLLAVGVDYAPFLGVLTGVLNIIPYFGPFIGMLPVFFIAYETSGIRKGVLAVILLLGLQQLDSNIIYPRIVGKSTGLHPLVVLVSVSVLGYFCGIWGMLLAVPIAGMLQLLILRWAESK